MKFSFVELDTGEQEFFERPADAFRFAKQQEERRTYSVEYVAVGDFYSDEGAVYNGQTLRILLRAVDNVTGWIKA